MARHEEAETLSARVQSLLRDELLQGAWEPGSKLSVAPLAAKFKTSSTVVREALMRLASEQLVQFRPNHGFVVRALSLGELDDLTELRCRAEEFAISLAIQRGGVAWESAVVAALHTLERTPPKLTDSGVVNPEWYRMHRAFHATLIEASGVPLLTDLAATLADATAFYRIWAARATPLDDRDIRSEHRAIVDAVIARDADAAGAHLREHYAKTTRIIRAAGLMPQSP